MSPAQFFATYGGLIQFLGINILLALGLYMTLSAGQLSLGTAAFQGIGAYTAGILSVRAGSPLLLSLLAGMLAAGVAALLLGLPVLRLRGIFLAIATLGFGEVARIVAVNATITGGAQGLINIPTTTGTWMIYTGVVLAAYFAWRLRGSHFGWAFAALREDETAARSMGVNATYYKTAAFTMGALIAGLAGGLYAHINSIISPGEFGFQPAVQVLLFNIVGGATVWYGPVLGAALLTLLPEVLRTAGVEAGPVRLFVNGLILLMVILFLPNGLASLFGRRRATLAGDESTADGRPLDVAGS